MEDSQPTVFLSYRRNVSSFIARAVTRKNQFLADPKRYSFTPERRT